MIDVFPSYYAKKNKKDDMLTIIEGFNRVFMLNSFGILFIMDFVEHGLQLVGIYFTIFFSLNIFLLRLYINQ